MKKFITNKLSINRDETKVFLSEQTTLFYVVLKWAILACIVGIIVGVATSIFLLCLKYAVNFGNTITNGHAYLMLPVIIPAVILLIRKLAPDAKGHGTEKVIEAIHNHNGRIDIKVVPVKLTGTIMTIGAGGSVGKEGPAAQIGAGLAYSFSRMIRLNKRDTKRLVICGISAGFAAVFGTPISGAIFGAEVLYLGLLQYDVMFPCLIAGVVAHIVCFFPHTVPANITVPELLATSHFQSVGVALLSGIYFGLIALLIIQALKWFEELYNYIRLNSEVKGFLGGIVLIGLFYLFPDSSGLSTDLLSRIFNGNDISLHSFWSKTIGTSLTLGFGGSGGIITPLFVIGASSGYTLAKLLGVSVIMLSAFGMVAVVSAAANTPIAASVMALELFGPVIGTYAAIACCTAYLVCGHRSVYPSQILGASKTSSILIDDVNTTINDLEEDDLQFKNKYALWLYNKLHHPGK